MVEDPNRQICEPKEILNIISRELLKFRYIHSAVEFRVVHDYKIKDKKVQEVILGMESAPDDINQITETRWHGVPKPNFFLVRHQGCWKFGYENKSLRLDTHTSEKLEVLVKKRLIHQYGNNDTRHLDLKRGVSLVSEFMVFRRNTAI